MKKIIYISSNIDSALSFEHLINHLDSDKFECEFILFNQNKKCDFETFLITKNIKYKIYRYSSNLSLFKYIPQLYLYFLKQPKNSIVHCFLFEASIIGLLTSRMAFISKRIYTRMHSSFHWEYYPKAVKFDKFNNRNATDVIATSKTVKSILLQENCKKEKIKLINYGFKFPTKNISSKENLFLETYPHLKGKKIIGVCSRFEHLKGIQYIIPIIKNICAKYPNTVFVFLNAVGPFKTELMKAFNKIDSSCYFNIEFFKKIEYFYHAIDVFVHIPINKHIEAFGKIYLEALYFGVPLVATQSGIANEILKHKENAYIVPFEDSHSVEAGIQQVLDDEVFKNKIIENGIKTAEKFTIENYINSLSKLYTQ